MDTDTYTLTPVTIWKFELHERNYTCQALDMHSIRSVGATEVVDNIAVSVSISVLIWIMHVIVKINIYWELKLFFI
jgi:hypothetical protein